MSRKTRRWLSSGVSSMVGGTVLLSGSCDATQLRNLGNGIIAVADVIDPQPEPSLGDAISSEIEDFFDKL